MANVIETATWDAGVYKVETTDQVIGGETGIDNKATKNLANRTGYLKKRITAGTALACSGGALTRITHSLNIPVVNQTVVLTYTRKNSGTKTWTDLVSEAFGPHILQSANHTVNYFDIFNGNTGDMDIDWIIYDTR